MTLTIRRYQPSDAAWLIQQHGRLYAAEFGFNAAFEVSIRRKLSEWLAAEDDFARLWIVEQAGQRVASAAIRRLSAERAFINFVLVAPQQRGRGLAEQLLQRAIAHARAAGCRQLRLETYSCLSAARRLYQRLGFRCVASNPAVSAYGGCFDQEFWQLGL